jgi:Peroxiredoxin
MMVFTESKSHQKMKKFLILAFLCFSVLVNAQDGYKKVSIEGKVIGNNLGKVYLQKLQNKKFQKLDSATVTNGNFSFSRELYLPEIYSLSMDNKQGSLILFLDKSKISVTLDPSDGYSNSVIKGSDLQDLYVSYKKDQGVKIDEFIKQHPNSLVSLYALYRDFSYRLTPEEIKANLQLLNPSLQNTEYGNILKELVSTMERVAVGKKAPDFALKDPEGNVVKLSDRLGKGYLLVDFWASWCGPCRKENPNVVKVYSEYKDKGFDVFGVSLDASKEPWLKAIEKDHLTWTHVSDLQFWNNAAAKLYGIRSIPSNLLLDKDGVIIAKNLRGEELEAKLAELLSQK